MNPKVDMDAFARSKRLILFVGRSLSGCAIILIVALVFSSARAVAQGGELLLVPAAAIAKADADLKSGQPQAAAQLLRDLVDQLSGDVAQGPFMGAAVLRLSRIAQLSGDFAAAERPLLEALRLLPPGDPAVQPVLAAIYISLGDLALARGENARAQIALLKGIAIARRVAAPDALQVIEAELALATAEIRSFRLTQAASRLSDLATRISADKPDFARTAFLYQVTLAELYFRRYEFSPALDAQQKALSLSIALYGSTHPETARALTSLGTGLFNAGEFAEAEAALLQALAIYEKDPTFFAPALATALVNLGQVYYVTGRTALARNGFTRAITLVRDSLGGDSQIEAAARLHRGYALLRQGDLASAVIDLSAAIGIWDLPATANRRAAAGAGVWLSEAERRLGNFDRAEAALAVSGHVLTEIFGPSGFAMSDIMVGRAQIELARGIPADAFVLLEQALSIREASLGPEHLAVEDIRSLAAVAAAELGWHDRALATMDASVARIGQRVALIQISQSATVIEEIAGLRRMIGRYVQAIDIIMQHAGLSSQARELLLEKSVLLAQLARSSAAGTAISGMGQRFATGQSGSGESEFGATDALRSVQEAQLRWQLATRQLTAMVVDGQSTAEDMAVQQATVSTLTANVQALKNELTQAHPDLVAAAVFQPITTSELLTNLRPKEILIAYLTLEENSYAWSFDGETVRLVKLPTDAAILKTQVDTLRATLDPKSVQSLSDIRPFATIEGWALYQALLKPLELPDTLHHLIIVPDGALQSLPFAALLRAPAEPVVDFADYRQLPWLIAKHEISMLPDIAALANLRELVGRSAAPAPFIGIGDPKFEEQDAPLVDGMQNSPARTVADLLRGLDPLPDSATELARLAQSLDAGPETVITGAAATEAAVKALPLAHYRVIAFATHGLVAGDFGRLREPGLALTPPESPSGEDDGLLTGGEIVRLRLDADWVILSACNTAAADGSPGAEGLSGLARAFFFAGSRSLVVSQWEVLSAAAVQLTTGIFAQMRQNPALTRAGALRRSMLSLLGEDQPEYFAHPIFWAPFQLVGEGGG